MESPFSRESLISTITKSPHRKLSDYIIPCVEAVQADPDFYAHFAVWHHRKGSVRDAKVAIPVLGLGTSPEYWSSHLGLLADLNPREFLKALNFAKDVGKGGFPLDHDPGPTTDYFHIGQRMLRRLVIRYLREYEASWKDMEWDAGIHLDAFRALYTRWHVKPSARANDFIVRNQPTHGRLYQLKHLGENTPTQIADLIIRYKLPWIRVQGALGGKLKEPDVLVAIIQRMTPAELTGNIRLLKKLGAQNIPAARAALEAALVTATTKSKGPLLKAGVAAKALEATEGEDNTLSRKLHAVQERKLKAASIEGDWLILADRSGSMDVAIQTAGEVAGFLAATVKGKVRMIFFDNAPRPLDVTGWTYAQIQDRLKTMVAAGGTSIGCGLQYVLNAGERYDGIILISDGADNEPPAFAPLYTKARKTWDKDIPLYWFWVLGNLEGLWKTIGAERSGIPLALYIPQVTKVRDMEIARFKASLRAADIPVTLFDLSGGVDYHSLPTLLQTLRTNRYSLVNEILDTDLVSLDTVLPLTRTGQEVIA